MVGPKLPGQVTRIKELWTTAAENSYELYLYAAALRRRYLDPAEGEYSPEFKDWYATHEMKTLLGNMSSFTKYALAGETVLYFAHDFEGGKYVNQLPVSRNALYELSQLVKPIQEGTSQLSENDLEKLFFAGGKDSEALIHPSASSSDIQSFRTNDGTSTIDKRPQRKKRFTVPVATIYVTRDIYKFNKKTGAHEGTVDISDTKTLIEELQKIVNSDIFAVSSNIHKIVKTYERKKSNSSPSRALKKASNKPKQ